MAVYMRIERHLGLIPCPALRRDPPAEAMRLNGGLLRHGPDMNRAHVAVEFHPKTFQVISFGLYRTVLALVSMCQSTRPRL